MMNNNQFCVGVKCVVVLAHFRKRRNFCDPVTQELCYRLSFSERNHPNRGTGVQFQGVGDVVSMMDGDRSRAQNHQ